MPGDTLRENLVRNLLVLAYYSNSPELEAVAGDEEQVDGTACTIVSVTFEGAESRLCIDAAGTVLKQAYQGKHPLQGTPGLIEIQFKDYTETDGRRIPYTQEVSFEGEKLVTMALKSIEFNPQLDPALFERPQ
jgi:hypothetical protein